MQQPDSNFRYTRKISFIFNTCCVIEYKCQIFLEYIYYLTGIITVINTLRVSVLYTGHQEQNNKWKNKAKTVKEQRTKEIEFNLQRLNAEFMAKPSTTAFVSSLDEHLTRFVEL